MHKKCFIGPRSIQRVLDKLVEYEEDKEKALYDNASHGKENESTLMHSVHFLHSMCRKKPALSKISQT